MTTQTIDPAKAEAFAGQVIGMVNGAMLSLGISVGHRTGLFDTMAGMSPATSDEIAKAAGLNERYVREWLGSMVTGGIIGLFVGPVVLAVGYQLFWQWVEDTQGAAIPVAEKQA